MFSDMNNDENNKEEIIINIIWANVYGFILIIPVSLLYGIPYYLTCKNELSYQYIKEQVNSLSSGSVFTDTIYLLLVIILGVFLHELLHGIIFALYTDKGFKSVKFGVTGMFTPYCHCKEPVKIKQYMLAALMPAIFLGFIPAAISISIENIGLLLFSVFFTVASIGDFMIIFLLRKENMNDFVQDHPSKPGCIIYKKFEDNNAKT